MKGPSRASVDSMVYSSEGSPPEGGRAGRGAGTTAAGEAAAAAEAASNIPASVLAWLNDDSAGSSDEEPPLGSRRGSKFAGTSHQQQIRGCTRGSASLPRTGSSFDSTHRGATAKIVAAAAAAAAASKISAGIGRAAASTCGDAGCGAVGAAGKSPTGLDLGLVQGLDADSPQDDRRGDDRHVSRVPHVPLGARCCSAGDRSRAGVASVAETGRQKGRRTEYHHGLGAETTSSSATSAAAAAAAASSDNPASIRAAAAAAEGPERRAQRSPLEDKGCTPAVMAVASVRAEAGCTEKESRKSNNNNRKEGCGRSMSSSSSNTSTGSGSGRGRNASENEMQRWLSLASDEDEETEEREKGGKGLDRGERGERSGSVSRERSPVSRRSEAGPEPRREVVESELHERFEQSRTGPSSPLPTVADVELPAALAKAGEEGGKQQVELSNTSTGDVEGSSAASGRRRPLAPHRRQTRSVQRNGTSSRHSRSSTSLGVADASPAADNGDGNDEADDEADETDDRPEFIGLNVAGGRVIGGVGVSVDGSADAAGSGCRGEGCGGGTASSDRGPSRPSGLDAAVQAAAAAAPAAAEDRGFDASTGSFGSTSFAAPPTRAGWSKHHRQHLRVNRSNSQTPPRTVPVSPAASQAKQAEAVYSAATIAAAAAVAGGDGLRAGESGDGVQVEIAPPLLGKFQSLVLDNRDIAGLARCLPAPDGSSGGRSPNSGGRSPNSGGRTPNSGGGGGDVPQQRDRPLRPELFPLDVAEMNSRYYSGGGGGLHPGSGASGSPGGAWPPGQVLPLDSSSGVSAFSFGSSTSTSMAGDEVNDFLLECTDGESLHDNDGNGVGTTSSVDGSRSPHDRGSRDRLGPLNKSEIEDFFRDTTSSSSACSSPASSSSSSSCCPPPSSSPFSLSSRRPSDDRRWDWEPPAAEGGGDTPRGRQRESGAASEEGAGGEGRGRVKNRRKTSQHRRRQRGGVGSGGERRREGSSPLPSRMRSLPKEDQRFMQDNLALRKGLEAVVGLNFDMLTPALQLKMMKPMTTTRHKKGEVILPAGATCRRFYVVLGAPRELLAVGEIPAVERSIEVPPVSPAAAAGSPTVGVGGGGGGGGGGSSPVSRKVCRLLAGQYFGEKGLLRQVECVRTATVVAASSVVDVASIDIDDIAVWEPFRMFVLMKEIPLLANLPMPSLHALQQTLRHQTFSAGEYIVRQGETGDTFYMIVKGTVDVLETSVDPETGKQRTRVLVQMFEGHYFGELALIYGEPRNASVRATEEVRCVCIAKEDFRSCMNEKRFQEVLEEVAYQRAFYREQRAQQLEEEQQLQLQRGRNDPGRCLFRSRSGGSASSRSPASRGRGGGRDADGADGRGRRGAESGAGGGRGRGRGPRSLTPPPPPHARSGSASSLRRSSFRETGKVVRRKLSNGTVVINKYRIVCELGRGSYGSVHLCRDGETGMEYAMKVMEKRRRGSSSIRSRQGGGQGAQQNHLAETLRREVAVMKKLRHPNIVTLWEVIDDPKAQQLYMIQEYVAEGPLLPEGVVVPPLGTEEAREKFVGCIRGLHYLHQHGVVHGDIKPQNLLVAMDGTVKIADFGAAVMLQQGESGEAENEDAFRMPGKLICTPAFTPPELFGASTTVSPACDVWAMGVTLYQMVYGTLPFWPPSGNHTELEIMVTHRELAFPSSSTTEEASSPAALVVAAGAAGSAGGGVGGGGGGGGGGSGGGVGKGAVGVGVDVTAAATMDEKERQKGSRSSSSLGVSTNLEAYDPMVGYLRNLLRRMLEKDPEQRIDLTAAINHPWVTVEGSIRPEGLEISVEPGFSDDGGQVEVTDGDLLDAWTMFPATPTPRGREYAFSFSPSSLSPGAGRGLSQPSNRHQQHQQRAGQFFPPQERYVYGCPLGGSSNSNSPGALSSSSVTPSGHSSASQVSPYSRSTAAESWSQLTPTAMGNITRFGWSSNGGGGGGGGGRGDDYRRFSRSLRGTESSSGYASGGGVKTAAREDDDEDDKNADSTYAEGDARGPTRAEGGGGGGGSRTPAERQGGARRGSLERRGGSGGVYGHAVRSVSPPSELPVHLPDDTPGAASGDLRHQRSYGRGVGGSGVSAEGNPDGEWTRGGGGDALRFSGISKGERRSFRGPSGEHPRREREPPQSADSTMAGVIPSPRSDRISVSSRHFDRDAGLTHGSGPRAADGDVDAWEMPGGVSGLDDGRDPRIKRANRSSSGRSRHQQQHPGIRRVASKSGSRSGGQGRRLMERCMTFPLASGQRAIHEAKLDSPSLRPAETRSTLAGGVSPRTPVASPTSSRGRSSWRSPEGVSMAAARERGWLTPPRHPRRLDRPWWASSGDGSGGGVCSLVRGQSTGCLPCSTSSTGFTRGVVPPRLSPGPAARRVPSAFFSAAPAASRLPLSSPLPDATAASRAVEEDLAPAGRRAPGSIHLAAAFSADSSLPSQRQQRARSTSSLSPLSPPLGRRSAAPAAVAGPARGGPAAVGRKELDKSGGRIGTWREGASDTGVSGGGDGVEAARQEARAGHARWRRASFSRALERCSGEGGGGIGIGDGGGDVDCVGGTGKDNDGSGGGGATVSSTISPGKGVSRGELDHNRASLSRRIDAYEPRLAQAFRGPATRRPRQCSAKADSATRSPIRPTRTGTLPFAPQGHERPPPRCRSEPPLTIGPRGTGSWPRLDPLEADKQTGASPHRPAGPRELRVEGADVATPRITKTAFMPAGKDSGREGEGTREEGGGARGQGGFVSPRKGVPPPPPGEVVGATPADAAGFEEHRGEGEEGHRRSKRGGGGKEKHGDGGREKEEEKGNAGAFGGSAARDQPLTRELVRSFLASSDDGAPNGDQWWEGTDPCSPLPQASGAPCCGSGGTSGSEGRRHDVGEIVAARQPADAAAAAAPAAAVSSSSEIPEQRTWATADGLRAGGAGGGGSIGSSCSSFSLSGSGADSPQRQKVTLQNHPNRGKARAAAGSRAAAAAAAAPVASRSTWGQRASDAGLRLGGQIGFDFENAAAASRQRYRRSSTGGCIGGSTALNACVGGRRGFGWSDSDATEYDDDDDEDLCDDWRGAVSVDPDAIELALPPPPYALDHAEDLGLVGFEPLTIEDIPMEPVQARTWGDQANLEVGVRYGHTAEIGSRRVMEDRTIAVNDIFKADVPNSLRSRSEGFFADLLLAASSAPAPAPAPAALLLPPPPPSPPATRLVATPDASAGGGAGDGRERGVTARAEADVAAQTEASPAAAAGGAPGGAAPAASSLVDRSKGAEGSRSFGADAPGRSAGAAGCAPGCPPDRSGEGAEDGRDDDSSECERPAFLAPTGEGQDGCEHDEGGAVRDKHVTAAAGHAPTSGENGVRREVRPGVQAQEQKPRSGLSAAFFGVYDGHDGDVVAEALQQSLHKLIAKQECFRDSVPEAIERGCYEMDTACLEAQFRALGREPSLSSPGVSPGTVEERAASPIVERGCEGSARGTTVSTAAALPPHARAPAAAAAAAAAAADADADAAAAREKGGCFESPERRRGAGGGSGERRRRGRKTSSGSDARSRLSGASSGISGGATAVVAIVTKVGEQAVIHTGNVGDCRAVLCRGGRAIDLTSDHRPSRDDERTRVKEAGGFISRDRLNGLLGVTRAFGDIAFKQFPPSAGDDMWQGQQLTSQPETSSVRVHPDDTFVILACDGVWDLVSSQQVVSYVQRRLLKHRDVQRASRELCKTLGKMSGSDNCSCVIICLNQVAVTPTVYSPRPVDAGRHRQTVSLSDAQVNSELQLDPERGFSWSAAGSSSPSPKKRPPKVYF